MMNELVKNQCDVTNHQVNVQFLLQLQPEWQRINRGTVYYNQRAVNVAGARENVGTLVVQKSGIQCYNCKEYGHVSRECQKPKRIGKDDTDDGGLKSGIRSTIICTCNIQRGYLGLVDNSWNHLDDEPMLRDQELCAHEETISIMSQAKEAHIKFYKTCKDKELDKVIALENKFKVLDDIVYKTGQSVQAMNMFNRNCKMSFAKLEFLKKAQRVNPRLCDIGYYNDNLALMLAPESDEMIRLDKESRSKLSDLIRPFDYDQLNNLYDLFVPQREKSPEHIFFRTSKNDEMVADLRYFNSLEHEVDTLKSQLETQKTQFLNEIDRLSREYYYADHMNAILGVYTDLDEVTNLQCDYLETLEKCEHLEKELSKSRTLSKSFEALLKHVINLELDLQQCKEKIKNEKSFNKNQSNVFLKEHERYFEIQDLKAQLQDKGIEIIIPTTSVSRPQLKSNHLEYRVMSNNSQGKKQEVEDHRRNFKFSNNKTSVTACNDSLNAKTSNVNFACVTYGKCMLNDNHDLCVLHYINGVNSKTRQPIAVPISTREPKHNVNQSVATSSKKTIATDSTVNKSRNITRKLYEQLVEIILFIVDSGCSKHMTGNLKLLTNFVEKFLGTVKFGNDQIAPILGSHGTDLYSITLQDSTTYNPICLMAKAISSQAWYGYCKNYKKMAKKGQTQTRERIEYTRAGSF
ncbi:retrovirus-related pol polyprotein from transposon TNT 1-94 [Tanacetum coccineum]